MMYYRNLTVLLTSISCIVSETKHIFVCLLDVLKNYVLGFITLKLWSVWGGLEDKLRLIKGFWVKGSYRKALEVEIIIFTWGDLLGTNGTCPVKCSLILFLKLTVYRQHFVPLYYSFSSFRKSSAVPHCSHPSSMSGQFGTSLTVPLSFAYFL